MNHQQESRSFKVAGLVFRIELPEGTGLWSRMTNYEPFAVQNGPLSGGGSPLSGGDEPLFTLSYSSDGLSSEGYRRIVFPGEENPLETRLDTFLGNDGSMLFAVAPNHLTPISGHILVSRDYTRGLVDRLDPFVLNNAAMLLYAFASTDKGVLEMHSSVVVNSGFGYMFLGKSGTGKSTHSRLWMENIPGTRLLNDDNPVIRISEDGTARVYGSPWSGKTPCYKNESAPIGGIVSLHQAPRNSISRLSLPQAYADILSSCSGLKFDSGAMDHLHETIASVVTSVQCYDLDCLPDADAARTCHRTVAPKAPASSPEAPSLKADKKSVEIPNGILLREAENFLREGREVVLMTKGFSMLPFIRGGRDSVVLVRQQTYLPGDVVLARLSEGNYVLHRIVEMNGDCVTLKGDGNLKGTEQCSQEGLCGKAVELQDRKGRSRKVRSAELWNRIPYTIRRYTLGILRRTLQHP